MENSKIVTVDLNERLLSIQEEISEIVKNKPGGRGFNYVDDFALNSTFKPLFDKYKILFYVEVIDCQIRDFQTTVGNKVQTELLYIVKCNMVFETSEEKKIVPYFGSDKNGFEDGLQGAITNARRVFLLKFFSVIQSEKNNNNQHTPKPQYQKQSPPPPVLSESDLLMKEMNESKTLAQYNSIFDRVMAEGTKDKSIKKIYWDIAKRRGYEFDKEINKFRKND